MTETPRQSKCHTFNIINSVSFINNLELEHLSGKCLSYRPTVSFSFPLQAPIIQIFRAHKLMLYALIVPPDPRPLG